MEYIVLACSDRKTLAQITEPMEKKLQEQILANGIEAEKFNLVFSSLSNRKFSGTSVLLPLQMSKRSQVVAAPETVDQKQNIEEVLKSIVDLACLWLALYHNFCTAHADPAVLFGLVAVLVEIGTVPLWVASPIFIYACQRPQQNVQIVRID